MERALEQARASGVIEVKISSLGRPHRSPQTHLQNQQKNTVANTVYLTGDTVAGTVANTVAILYTEHSLNMRMRFQRPGYLPPEEMRKAICKVKKVRSTSTPAAARKVTGLHSEPNKLNMKEASNQEKIATSSALGHSQMGPSNEKEKISNGEVLLVPPSTSSLLSNPLIAPNIFNDLKLFERSLVLMAINDKQDSADGDEPLELTNS
ncbi:hypothetical protein BAE44_0026114 [Dichanthelium oligosanthes]|uniref:Uncharacterized protein n=1 Tax=Dichanthelium oligosanthes TaxID=888268 RepID=A0A1E5UJ29_9POAL|nr:hypothetical protein BAE44_0026114 [Dichanthelium oligosanthes]